jgi:hypothetical protein
LGSFLLSKILKNMIVSVIILSIVLTILIFYGINEFNHWRKQKKEFQLFQQQVKPGIILVREYKSANPFLEPIRTKYKVLNVKDGWCEYILLSFLNFSNYKEMIRYDTIKHLYEIGYKTEET